MKKIASELRKAPSSEEFIQSILDLARNDHKLLVRLLREFAHRHGCVLNGQNLAFETEQGRRAEIKVVGEFLHDIRVVGGAATRPEEFPECVALLRGKSREVVGTGLIVGPNLVLGAGHSVNSAVDEIWVGVEVGIDKGPRAGKPYKVQQKRKCPHFGYVGERPNGAPPKNDIGFLTVDGLDGSVQPARLAEPGEVGSRGELTGWLVGFGSNEVSGGGGAGTQRMARIPVIWDVVTTANGQGILMDREREFVAGTPLCSNDPKDACGDDSGAPFYVTIEGRPKVFGLTSRGARRDDRKCGSGAVYTRVDAYSDWIAQALASNGKNCP